MVIPTKVLAAALFVVLVMTTPARAGPIDDVKSIVTSISTKVNAIRSSVNDVRSQLNASAALLTGRMQTMINDAVDDLKALSENLADQIEEDRADRDAFVNGPEGEAFRSKILGFLTEFESLSHNLAQLAPGSLPIPQANFDPLMSLIEKFPLRLLWPVYKVSSQFDFLSDDLMAKLQEANDALVVLAPLFDDGTGSSSRAATAAVSSYTRADVRDEKDKVVSRRKAVKVLRTVTVVLTYAGKAGGNLSKYAPKLDTQAEAWGWAGFTLNGSGPLDAIGGSVELLGDILGKIADFCDKRLDEKDGSLNTQSLRLTIQDFVGSGVTVPKVYPYDGFNSSDTFVCSDLELSTWATLTRMNQIAASAGTGSQTSPSWTSSGRHGR
jgi:hypothetical protein